MKATFHLEIQKKPLESGIYPVYIRITQNRKLRRIKTSIALRHFKDWNPKGEKNLNWVRTSEPHHKAWNEQLAKELEEAKNTHREKGDTSIDSLKAAIDSQESRMIFYTIIEGKESFAQNKVEEAKPTESLGTYKHYRSTLVMLGKYMKSKGIGDLYFSDIDLSFLKSYGAFLGKVENQRVKGRTLDKTTIANYLKKLRKLVYEAVEEGKIPVEKNPFLRFSINQKKETAKEKLDMEEINSIIDLDIPKGSLEWHTRNAWLFSFYNAGIRAGDLLQLRWNNVEKGRLVYKMGKNGKERNLELVQEAKQILELYLKRNNLPTDYIFPFLDSSAVWAKESAKDFNTMPEFLKKALFNQVASRNVIMNRCLKRIALKAGINKKVTMHTSRHSFANMAMREGVESSKIQGLLAHSSLSTTEGYMGYFGRKEEDEVLAKVAEAVTGRTQSVNSEDALISALKRLDKETLAKVLKAVGEGQ